MAVGTQASEIAIGVVRPIVVDVVDVNWPLCMGNVAEFTLTVGPNPAINGSGAVFGTEMAGSLLEAWCTADDSWPFGFVDSISGLMCSKTWPTTLSRWQRGRTTVNALGISFPFSTDAFLPISESAQTILAEGRSDARFIGTVGATAPVLSEDAVDGVFMKTQESGRLSSVFGPGVSVQHQAAIGFCTFGHRLPAYHMNGGEFDPEPNRR